nr:MAG TPA_asm: hypothetical protein [Caudoviricetes sp.]
MGTKWEPEKEKWGLKGRNTGINSCERCGF